MDMPLPQQLFAGTETATRRSSGPGGRPWPRLVCFTAALLASGGLWMGLIALARQIVAG